MHHKRKQWQNLDSIEELWPSESPLSPPVVLALYCIPLAVTDRLVFQFVRWENTASLLLIVISNSTGIEKVAAISPPSWGRSWIMSLSPSRSPGRGAQRVLPVPWSRCIPDRFFSPTWAETDNVAGLHIFIVSIDRMCCSSKVIELFSPLILGK